MSTLPNTFQVFNFYIDRAMELLTDSEFRVLMYATRHILGWQDRIDDRQGCLSLTMFERGFTTKDGAYFAGCGLGRGTIIDTIESLITFGFMRREGQPTQRGQKYTLLAGGIQWEKLETRKKDKAEADKKRTRKATAKSMAKRAGGNVARTTPGGTSDVTGTGTSHVTMQGNVARTTGGNVARTESNPLSNSPSNPISKNTGSLPASPKISKPVKYPDKLKNWNTQQICQYHTEHAIELNTLTTLFYPNSLGITLPLMTNLESIAVIGLHKELDRLQFPTDQYAALIEDTRKKNTWKKNGIQWEDVLKNVTAFKAAHSIPPSSAAPPLEPPPDTGPRPLPEAEIIANIKKLQEQNRQAANRERAGQS